ncbi:MAG: pentapeptide repeat-containing protein, partial [Alphaproteobacteria bacterium]|nr:pentapeptide repeat-containing protein [Alphaproteobacteria bacterium]
MSVWLRSLGLSGLAVALVLGCGGAVVRAACTDVAGPKVDWRRCSFDAGDFAKQNLSGAVLRETSFVFADLTGADLSSSDAYDAKFLSANLTGARLDHA